MPLSINGFWWLVNKGSALRWILVFISWQLKAAYWAVFPKTIKNWSTINPTRPAKAMLSFICFPLILNRLWDGTGFSLSNGMLDYWCWLIFVLLLFTMTFLVSTLSTVLSSLEAFIYIKCFSFFVLSVLNETAKNTNGNNTVMWLNENYVKYVLFL